MLKIEDLEKFFSHGLLRRKKVLDKVSFVLTPHRITGFLGPNGAGKTTTIRIVMGLLKADKGRIEFNGKEINDETRKKIGYLPENPSFYPYLTPRELLYIIGEMEGMGKDAILKKIDEISHKLFFKEFLDNRISTLSKGTLQKVAFSQALTGEPELVILDEPFSGLDPIVMNEIRTHILNLRKENKTVLISSHMLLEMERICDDVVLINQGKIILTGNVFKLKERWRIIKAIENNEGLKSSILKGMKTVDFAKKIIADDKDILELTNLEPLVSELSRISLPTLENIFLEAVKFFKLPKEDN